MGNPSKKDISDYMCFLGKTGKLPDTKIAELLGVSRNNVSKKASRGALWTDHFLAAQKAQLQEINASDLENFDIENYPKEKSIFHQ